MRSILTYKYKNSKREYFWVAAVYQSIFDFLFSMLMLIFAIVANITNFAGHEKGWGESAIAFFIVFIIFFILTFATFFLAKRICGDYDEHIITTWIALIFGFPILCLACVKSLRSTKVETNKPAEEKIEEIKETPDTTTEQIEATA